MRKLLLLAGLAVFLAPGAVSAQWSLGGQLNYGTDFDFGMGARVAWGWPFEPGAETVASFDLFFPRDDFVDYWEINININQPLPIKTDELGPYIGAGLNWAHASISGGSRDWFGLNLLIGLKYATPSVTPFGEVRTELGGGKQWVFTGGVMFPL